MAQSKGYSINQGTQLIQTLAESGLYLFTTDDAKLVGKNLGIGEEQVWVILHHLTEAGWISRVKRGLYIGTGKLPGESQVHPFAIATRLVQPAAISYWSAMNHHGLTEQLPKDVTAMTTQKVYPPSLRSAGREGGEIKKQGKHAWIIEGLRYDYVTVKPDHFFGIEEVWIDQMFRIPITDKERTLLEGFAFSKVFGSLSEVLGILEEHLKSFDITKLVEYAIQYDSIAVIKRLGWALDQVGIPLKRLQSLKEYPATGYRLLDPTKSKVGNYDSRWMIQNNLKG